MKHFNILFIFSMILSFSTLQAQPIEFLNAENAPGHLPFSQAVRVGGTLYLSGQIGIDPKTSKLVSGGMKNEAVQTMENIKNTLELHNYSMKDVIKCTVMLADISQWEAFNSVYVSYFSKPYPARSAFAASGLALGSLIEVECIAAQ